MGSSRPMPWTPIEDLSRSTTKTEFRSFSISSSPEIMTRHKNGRNASSLGCSMGMGARSAQTSWGTTSTSSSSPARFSRRTLSKPSNKDSQNARQNSFNRPNQTKPTYASPGPAPSSPYSSMKSVISPMWVIAGRCCLLIMVRPWHHSPPITNRNIRWKGIELPRPEAEYTKIRYPKWAQGNLLVEAAEPKILRSILAQSEFSQGNWPSQEHLEISVPRNRNTEGSKAW